MKQLQWFALLTKARHEKVVRDRLAGKGIQPFLPTTMKLSQWHDRKKRIEVPLFGGYCFVQFAPQDKLEVLKVVGVLQIVGSSNGRPPSEYLRENCWYTFQKDPVAVETRDRVGLDRLMWASDYPHSDSTWPHSRKVIERDFEGVPDADLAAIVCDNAARLYGISV